MKKGVTAMKVTYSDDERHPIEISNSYEKVSIDIFAIQDDDDWNDFINALNQLRKGVLNGYYQNFSKKIAKRG